MRETFTKWLLQQAGRDDPIGDLSRDVARDPDWPAGSDANLGELAGYLRSMGACRGALQALRKAWREWSKLD